ncbi:bacteriocin [Pseudoalteromonas rubra]|uniref:bacteriocin n=1 Tax=Pseudoalteromonas rubra TaxID=43658 RepID=UPI001107C718
MLLIFSSLTECLQVLCYRYFKRRIAMKEIKDKDLQQIIGGVSNPGDKNRPPRRQPIEKPPAS